MPARRAALVSRWAAILVFVTVALGSVVCVTDSSSSCPAWPACYPDQFGPELRTGWLENPIIEFVHRAISFSALVLLGWSGWLGRRHADVRVRVLPWVALACAIGSAVFGMMIILFTLPLSLSVLDLAFALIALCLITVTAAALRPGLQRPSRPISTLAGSTFGLLVAMHLLGSIVAGATSEGTGSFTRCLSWPLWHLVEIDRFPALQVVRIAMAGAGIVLIALLVVALLRAGQRALAVTLGILVIVELAAGAAISAAGITAGQTNGIQATLAVVYSLVAVAILWVLSICLGFAQKRGPGTASDTEVIR